MLVPCPYCAMMHAPPDPPTGRLTREQALCTPCHGNNTGVSFFQYSDARREIALLNSGVTEEEILALKQAGGHI